MDLNSLLIWFVCISCMVNLVRGLQHQTERGWVIVSSLLLGLMLALWYRQPQTAGLVGGIVWAIFVVLPIIGMRMSNFLAIQHRFESATRWAYLGRLFHPLDGWWNFPKYYQALALAQSGRMEAVDLLHSLKNNTSALRQAAYLTLFRIQGDWSGLRDWMEQDITLEKVSRTPHLIPVYLRALGEIGTLNEMVEALERFEPALLKAGQTDWIFCCMIVLAYCGQVAPVSRLLQSAVKSSRDRKFWLATALMAAGNPEAALADIADLLGSHDLLFCATLKNRNERPRPDPLNDRSRDLLIKRSRDLDDLPQRGSIRLKTAPITLLLISLNIIAFTIEIQQGGSTDPYTLYRLGALVPAEVAAGAWWRLLTATFLHFGFVHLLLNMLALAVLGPFVERQLGWIRYSLSYLAVGVGSMTTITILAMQGLSRTTLALGASGAVMGLIGVEAGILLLLWRRRPSRFVGQRLRLLGLIVALQTFFDLTMPHISFVGHISGVVLGLIAGLIFRSNVETGAQK